MKCIIALAFWLAPAISQAQQNKVIWRFETHPIAHHDLELRIVADIAPGWHLYSQFMAEGGPQPTKFRFENAGDFRPIGKAVELGKAQKKYNDLFEMNVIWFNDHVAFIQKIKPNHPLSSIKVAIDYMVCNDEQCIPAKDIFTVDIPSPKN